MLTRSFPRLATLRYPLVLAVALMATACGKGTESTAPAASTPAASTAATPTDTAATPAAATAPAQTRQPGPIVPPQGPAPVLGTDYEEIPGGQPWQPEPGKVEVVEVFGYICPACAAFAPTVEPWHMKLPADVNFHYVAAPFGPEWIPYAKAYYASEQLGLVDKTHMALIDAIHVKKTLPGEGDPVNEQKIADFYGQYGANPKQFLDMMQSFAVSTKINQGRQFMQKSGVTGTPTIIIDGKYRITGGKSYQDVLRIADHLIAMERAAMAGTPAAAPAAAPAAPATGTGG
ncbi:thiol:disulfide interchange protein DsbA/DsbL [Lysobacter sp. TY2-98]|uniref:thiol:disulfide interchange protein DsbA/DsbL n=1 Tax=Lysobacter sp. TY2-98 TaxID=2290922 RepID=UPI0013B3B316|nr:thiol:disulfide interchange protein DsbA/DsbL [Lysobacter sp. TY2-98]